MKRLAYISRQYIEQQCFVNGLKKYFDVEDYRHWYEVKDPNSFDIIMVETDWGVVSQRIKHKNLIVLTKGMDVYVGKLRNTTWENINWFFTLSKHQLDYFKTRWEKCNPKNTGIVPVIAPLEHFILRKDPVQNNKVALIANITDRKGTYQIPDFLLMFPDLVIHHLGSVELYGEPVREYVRWRLEKDGTADRYIWQNHIPQDQVNDWLEDKTYIWLPSISEGFNRAVLEGMCKGLKPIVKRFAGADDIWMKESLYDKEDEIRAIIEAPYQPKEYRKFVKDRYNVDLVIDNFIKLIS